MATITVKNIPGPLYERLKYLAKIHRRSLNGEIIYNLEKSVGLAQDDPDRLRKQAEAFREKVGKRGALTPEEVEGTINGGRP